jgi:hypothetical protein
MKNRNFLPIVCTLLLLTMLNSAEGRDRKVLFIGIDGVRSDALIKANTPTMDSIFQAGFFTYTSWHLGITVSAPSWSSMLCGVWEPKHGVTSNAYTNSKYDRYPYFVTRAKEERPDLYAVQITSWAPMSEKVYNDGWDEKIVLNSDDACIAAAVTTLETTDKLDILFVHIDDADAVGHGNGFNPNLPIYINQLEYIDRQVGEILSALKARPNYSNEDWLVMFTTDHGGIGTGHGGITREEKRIWWSATGSTVEPGEITININDATQWFKAPLLVDIAVTALDHLLPDIDPTQVTRWDLDGRSWLKKTITSTGKNVNNDPALKVSPNPFVEYIEVQSDNLFIDNIKVFDVSGALIKELKGISGQSVYRINLADVPAGTYNVNVEAGSRLLNKTVIKF